jgi:hypothetical protein
MKTIKKVSDFSIVMEFANEWLQSNYKDYFKVKQNRMIFNQRNELINNGNSYFNFENNEQFIIHRDYKKTKVCWIKSGNDIIFKMKNLNTGEMDVIKITSDLNVYTVKSVVITKPFKKIGG